MRCNRPTDRLVLDGRRGRRYEKPNGDGLQEEVKKRERHGE